MRLTADVIVVSEKAMCCVGVLHLEDRCLGQVVVAERERDREPQTRHTSAIEGWGAFAGWIRRVCGVLTERFPCFPAQYSQVFGARWRRPCLFSATGRIPHMETQQRKSKVRAGGAWLDRGGGESKIGDQQQCFCENAAFDSSRSRAAEVDGSL